MRIRASGRSSKVANHRDSLQGTHTRHSTYTVYYPKDKVLDRKQIPWLLGNEVGGGCDFRSIGVELWGGGSVLCLDCGNGFTNLCMQ